MADKNRERCKRRATEELLTRSIEHLAKLAVLDHRDDLKLHEVAPHQRELRERPHVIAFEEVETAAEIRSRPPAEQFGTLRGSTAGCLKSPDRLVARFGFRLQGEGEHEFHRAFPFSLRGSSLPGPPRAGTRLVARWMHPWRHQGTAARSANGNERPAREHSHAKNVLPLWNPKEEANAAAWRFGYFVGRRIIHTTL